MTRVLEPATPGQVGLSPDGLARVDAAVQAQIDKGVVAGAITLVARHGKLVHTSTLGVKDLASGKPLQVDSLFRIFSMTKPITGTAMLILHDAGLWSPEDPIAKHLPELAGMKVLAGFDAAGQPVLEQAARAPTMGELMTHRAGFAYGIQGSTPEDKLYHDAGLWSAADLNEFVQRLATVPLVYQPGSTWRYSLAMDLQGAIIERLSGQSLPDFMQARIFGPLGMVDTAFHTPPEKRERRATLYFGAEGAALMPLAANPLLPDHDTVPSLALGGAGLISTAPDYARYAQMLLNGGEFAGKRIVSEVSVKAQMTNYLPDELLERRIVAGHQKFRPGFGYGYNGVVFTDPELAGIPVGKGTYHWDGAAGTWFWVDPENDLLFVGLIQLLSYTAPPLQATTQKLMADAILD
ncbi:serine hydrolase domain-containing protein [Sphingomonas sp. ERG5]|uniref:serine hydrolase domain-containing protein n=1 Tax=Sphingomonas sp. ERG5 TaxID=1381597 RepID=UPI00054B7988|nr:serine hydrolase domain-containing protein [Sphingomonas sp. ERG5]